MNTLQNQTAGKKINGKGLPSKEVKQLASFIHDNGLSDDIIELLSDRKYTDGSRRRLYTLYLGIDQHLTSKVRLRISRAIDELTEGYTLVEAFGKFKGMEERSILIQLGVENPKTAFQCAENLRSEFDQNGVGIVTEQIYKRVVNQDQRMY